MNAKTGGLSLRYLLLLILLSGGVMPLQAQLSADFSADKTGGCSPLTIQFSNLTRGAGSNASFFWDLGNGNTSINRNVSATYITEKTYTVSLTVTEGSARSVKTMQIVVSRKPVADFEVSSPHGCVPFTPVFTSKSTTADGTLTSFVWEFGDGSTETTSLPSVRHTFTKPMSPVVTLTAVNNYGCGSIIQKQAITEVLPALTAGFTADKTILCSINEAVSFTNTTTGPGNLTYQWDFGNTQTSSVKNATYVYPKTGEYSVKLTASNDKGCENVFTLPTQINVASFKLDVAVPEVLCSNPGYHSFTASVYPLSYNIQWNFSNNTTNYGSYVSQYISTAGDYTVKVKALFGTCPVEVTKPFKVHTSPKLDGFEIPDPLLCGTPATLVLKDTTNWSAKWSWNVYNPSYNYTATLADKVPSLDLTKDGYYSISLTATDGNGCTASTSKGLTIMRPVVTIAAFNSTATNGYLTSCGAFSSGFRAFSSAGTITSYEWDPGNGSAKSTDATPSYTFDKAGNYGVSLKYKTSEGCTGTVSVLVTVNTGHTIGFTGPKTVCGDNPVTFQSTGVPGNGANANYFWSFTSANGRGNYYGYNSGVNSDGYFSDTGWYNVKLQVTSGSINNYCSSESTQNNYIQVLPPMRGLINVINNCTDNKGELTFSESSRYTESWLWDFGDGETLAYTKATKPAKVIHVYKKNGRYNVTLTVSAGACSFKMGAEALVLLDPTFTFTNDAEVCGNKYAGFNNTGSIYVSTYGWAFANVNGATAYSAGAAPRVNFPDTGWFSGKLTFTVNNCVYEGDVKPNVIKVLPPYPGMIGSTVTCNANRGEVVFSETSKGTEKWDWNFGDGETMSYTKGNKPAKTTHAYKTSGKYNVVLSVTTGACSFDMDARVSVLMKQKPQLSAIQTAVCINEPLKITLQGFELNPRQEYPNYSHYGTPIVQYEDGSFFTGYQQNTVSGPLYHPGIWETVYTANLNGLARDRQQIRMITAPFGFSEYADCPDTSNYVVMRIDGPTSVLKLTKNQVCNKEAVIFEDLSTVPAGNSIVNRVWNFGDGQTQSGASTANPVRHIYSNIGSYNVSLMVTDNNGCSATSNATAVTQGPRAGFSVSPTPATNKNTVYIYNSSYAVNSAIQYKWSFSYDGFKTTETSPAPRTYPKGGPATDTIVLVAYNATTGCSDTAIQLLPVVNVNNAFTMSRKFLDGGCAPVLVLFTNISYNYNSFKWDFGDGTTLDDPTGAIRTPGHIYEKPGTYKVTLYGAGIGNSKDTTADSVVIKPPAFAANVKASLREACTAEAVQLSAEVKNSTDITWDYGDGTLAKTGNASISYTYSGGGIYKPAITVRNGDGCPAAAELNYTILIDSLNLQLNPQPVKICDSAVVDFNPVVKNLGAERLGRSLSYSWNFGVPGAAGNASTAVNPGFKYNKKGNYRASLRVQSQAGCDKTVTADIRVIETPVLNITAPAEACAQTELRFLGSALPEEGVKFTWDFKNGQTAASLRPSSVTYNTPGNYQVQLKADNDGCTRVAEHAIIIHQLPTVNPLRDTTMVYGMPLPLQATGSNDIVKWSWSPQSYLDCANCAATIAQPKNNMRYQVTGYNQYGCTASASMNVKLICAETPIFIPNTFTPNKDGRNDWFYPRGKGVKVVKYFRIYNRLGEMIFERRNFALNDAGQGWDGTYMGKPLANSVFTYTSEMICDAGESFLLKGTIMLMH